MRRLFLFLRKDLGIKLTGYSGAYIVDIDETSAWRDRMLKRYPEEV